MGRFLIPRVLLLLLLGALLAPVLELIDRWDSTPGLASDTEFHVAAMAIAAGLLATVALVAARICCLLVPFMGPQPCAASAANRMAMPLRFFSGSSPPGLPLRI
jgi:hypothetical protein